MCFFHQGFGSSEPSLKAREEEQDGTESDQGFENMILDEDHLSSANVLVLPSIRAARVVSRVTLNFEIFEDESGNAQSEPCAVETATLEDVAENAEEDKENVDPSLSASASHGGDSAVQNSLHVHGLSGVDREGEAEKAAASTRARKATLARVLMPVNCASRAQSPPRMDFSVALAYRAAKDEVAQASD